MSIGGILDGTSFRASPGSLLGGIQDARMAQETKRKELIPDFAAQALLSGQMPAGPDPRYQEPIFWNQSRPVDPSEERMLAAQADPKRALESKLDELFPKKPDPFTLGEGQVRYSGTGEEVARGPSNVPERERNIQDYMNTYNVDRATAIKMVDKQVNAYTDPFTGNTTVFDRVGTLTGGQGGAAVPPSGQTPPSPAPSPREDIIPVLSDVTKYGAAGAVPEALEKTVGQFGLFSADPNTIQQRQRYRLLRERVLDAYARAGRPSNYAQQRIEELMPSTGVFESPESAWDKFSVLYDELQGQLESDMATAADTTMPVDIRREARASAQAAQRALRLIGDPTKFKRPSGGGSKNEQLATPKTDADYAALPSGAVYIDPDDGKKYRKP